MAKVLERRPALERRLALERQLVLERQLALVKLVARPTARPLLEQATGPLDLEEPAPGPGSKIAGPMGAILVHITSKSLTGKNKG